MASDVLLAANERLHQLRKQLKTSTQYSVLSGQSLSKLGTDNCVPNTASLPPHLGWESAAVTAVLRKCEVRREKGEEGSMVNSELPMVNEEALASSPLAPPSSPFPLRSSLFAPPSSFTLRPSLLAPPLSLRLFPTLAAALLRQGQVTTGRLWLLLRHLDKDGRGWVALAEAREQFTQETSPLSICGWRQLRQLLQDGAGVFWQCGQERIWLRSAAKVCLKLDIHRLSGQPVLVPISALLGSIGQVRAALYACYHSGRAKRKQSAAPIARATLETVTGVSAQSQRNHERRTHMAVGRNFAIGEAWRDTEQAAWEKGYALFPFQDFSGEQGAAGRTYVAWQLPNSYHPDYLQTSRGVQRRINRQLSDLLRQGTTGNGEPGVKRKRYYPSGAAAAQAFNRLPEECYWPGKQNGRTCLWYVLR